MSWLQSSKEVIKEFLNMYMTAYDPLGMMVKVQKCEDALQDFMTLWQV